MDKWQKILGTTLAAAAIAATGCAGTAPFKQLAAKFDASAPKKEVSAAPKKEVVVRAGAGVGHRRPAEKKSVAENVTGAWKSMSSKVAGAFAVKPKEKKPVDPIRLDSDPGPINPSIYVATAQILEKSGRLDEAKKQYVKAIESQPTDKNALIGLARLHDRQGDFASAEKYYLRVVKAHPNHAEFYNDLGLCLARQKKTEQAANVLAQAVEADPDKALYRNNLATVLVEIGRHDEALEHFAAAQDESIAHYNLGYLLSKKNETAEAIRHLQIARQLNPSFTQAQQLLTQLDAQPASSEAPTYRLSDNAVLADRQVHRIPAQLTSGVTLSRLPLTEPIDVDDGTGSARTSDTRKTSKPNAGQPEAHRPDHAKGVSYEVDRPASSPPADDDVARADDASASADDSFTPNQPKQMSPPTPAP